MPVQRPTSVFVLGILNIVFGSIRILLALCAGVGIAALVGMAGQMQPPPGGGPNPFDVFADMDKSMPHLRYFFIGSLVLGALMAVLLLIAGIGLIRMRPWARYLTLFYAVASILLTLGEQGYTLAVVNPQMEQWQRDYAQRNNLPAGNQPSNPVGSAVGGIVGAVLGTIYSVVLLVFMLRGNVAAAFAGRGVSQSEDEFDYDRPPPSY